MSDRATGEVLTPQQAANRIGISRNLVMKMVDEGRLRSFRLGEHGRRRYAIEREDVEAMRKLFVEETVDAEEAADRLGVNTSTIYRAIRRREIPGVRFGKLVRVRAEYVEAHEKPKPPPAPNHIPPDGNGRLGPWVPVSKPVNDLFPVPEPVDPPKPAPRPRPTCGTCEFFVADQDEPSKGACWVVAPVSRTAERQSPAHRQDPGCYRWNGISHRVDILHALSNIARMSIRDEAIPAADDDVES